MQTEVLWLAGFGALVWFWVDTLRARERAVKLCRSSCEQRGLQFLDQTVALERLTPARDQGGRMRWRRRYRFEFTRDGAARERGTIVMIGSMMEAMEMPHDGGTTYEHL
ncbi:MAG: DUF3301 domain-containing protein [Xanthomonadaceae bacterium]|nr:DUF3301 domain-containing protein [Xanthomonadaceae bacterium]